MYSTLFISDYIHGSVQKKIGALAWESAIGGLFGYGYALCADLSPIQTVKAFAIWSAAATAFQFLQSYFPRKNLRHFYIQHLVLSAITTPIAIHELRQRQLMGDALMYYTIGSLIMNIAFIIFVGNKERD